MDIIKLYGCGILCICETNTVYLLSSNNTVDMQFEIWKPLTKWHQSVQRYGLRYPFQRWFRSILLLSTYYTIR